MTERIDASLEPVLVAFQDWCRERGEALAPEPLLRYLNRVVHGEDARFLEFAPPGHFYSPLPAHSEVCADDRGLELMAQLGGVDLREEEQRELVRAFARYYPELPSPAQPVEGIRYCYENEYFPAGDAIVLYCFLRHFRPKRVVEVGSGFSSAVMLDTAERFLPEVSLTFIEPHPERLHGLLRGGDEGDRCTVLAHPIQQLDPEHARELEPGDILFVDSSHVAKHGSDVLYVVFHILPRLRPGVLVHFHDICWPFEYPREWLEEGRAWNEAYLLRAFLMFNRAFRIRLWTPYLVERQLELVDECLPLVRECAGSSLWLERVDD